MSTVDVIKQFAEENAKLKQQLQKANELLEDSTYQSLLGIKQMTELKKYMTKFGCLCGDENCPERSVYLKYPEANLQPAYLEAMKGGKDFKVISRSKLASSTEEEALVGNVTMDQINTEVAEADL